MADEKDTRASRLFSCFSIVLACFLTAACRPAASEAKELRDAEKAGQGWRCRNEIEIQCSEGQCTAADSFTPMSVELAVSGYLSVCAYSGCSEGQGSVHEDGQFLAVTAHNMPISPSTDEPDRTSDAAIVLDRSDGTALLKMGAFAIPFSCSRTGG